MDLEDLRVDFNAVLTSGGGSLTEKQFMSDFRSLTGQLIPYRELGHQNVKSLLQSLGGFNFSIRGGESVISSRGDEKTAHIASLIARQKKKPGTKKVRGRKSAYSYHSRPSKPPPLMLNIIRRRPAPVHFGTQRPAPPPRFGNPPVIPQRQPLVSAQSRLETKEAPAGRVSSFSSGNINVPEAKNLILSENCDNRTSEISSSKVPAFVEVAVDEATFIDLQWLHAKVKNVQVSNKPQAETPEAPPQTASISNSTLNCRIEQSSAPLPSRTTNKPEQTVIFQSREDELNSLAARLNLPAPVYSEIKRKPTRGRPVYLAKVKIGDRMFSSYPEERETIKEAKELVARIALEELNSRPNKVITPELEPKLADCEIEDRVYHIVKPKVNGIFEEAVVIAYQDRYGTSIPTSWLDVIRRSSKFSIESFNCTRTIIYPVYEVSDAISSDEAAITVSQPAPTPTPAVKCNGEVSSSANLRLDINSNTVTVADSKPRTLPRLILPTTNTWDVYVASVSTNDIWVRLIGDDYDAKYNDVMTDLELKMDMMKQDEVVTHPVINEYYCVKSDSCYIRVQLRDILSDEECEVFLVDNGELDTFPLKNLRVLSNEYMNLPGQAVQCRLSYLDLSYETAQFYLMENVIGTSFVAEVVKTPTAENSFARIILHNTNDEKLGAININYQILEEIVKKMEQPKLTQRHVAFMKVTHCEPNMSPYCQVQGKDLTFLEEVLQEIYDNQDLVELHGLNAHPRVNIKSEQKQFLCKYRKSWRRGTILDSDDPRKPLVYFIDFGHKENILLSDIFDLEKVLPPLVNFPAQAIQVNLLNLPPPKLNVGVIHRIMELAPPNIFVLGKLLNSVGGLYEVELFKRVQPDNMIASINADLIFNYEEYSLLTIEKLSKASSSPQRVSPACMNPLNKYPLPSVDCGFFDVSVSMSSNPFNFVVQPLQSRAAFDAMMKDLQDLYETQHLLMPYPTIDEVNENTTFAAKHPEDLTWYRVSVVTALSDSMVSVRYADFGDVGLVPLDQLRYLEPKFRLIPSLAVRAKLHGVKPKGSVDWSVSQCAYFTELVDGKSFVSTVMDINSDSNSNSWQLSLKLIDTTAENVDVDIGELLVRDEMADIDN